MSEQVTFLSLEVEAFRGFRDRREFPLDGSAVIVAGPNGTGKTSFFDALQWLLLGSLKRLEPLKTRQTDEWIVNQYRLSGPATVSAEIVLAGRRVRLRRSGNARDTLLEWQEGETTLRGVDAQRELEMILAPSPTISLETAMFTAGLLQQDIMRSALEAKPNERFEVLNRLLGLDSLERFDNAVTEWAKNAKAALDSARGEEAEARRQRQQIESRLMTAEAEAAARPSVEAAQAELGAALERHSQISVQSESPIPPAEMSTDLSLARTLIARTRSRLEAIVTERAGLPPPPDAELTKRIDDDLAAATDRAAARSAEANEARRASSEAAQSGSEFARLAAAAIPLLSEICPVCEQDIDPNATAEALRRRADDDSEVIALQEAAERAEKLAAEAGEQRDALALQAETFRRQSAQHVELNSRTSEAFADLSSGIERLHSVAIRLPGQSLEALSDLQALSNAIEDVDQAAQRLVAATDLGSSGQRVRELRAEIAALRETEQARSERAKELARRQVEAKNLQEATVAARVEVGRRRVDMLTPLVADIYNRLDPHPSFKELGIEHDIYRARGTMSIVARDPLTGNEEKPSLIFSSSQANIAALSYFLALGWTAGEAGVPFVLLDDPLQSMDDVNVLGFADLCRFIRLRRQLFLSTHERRFALLLRRKLAPRRPDDKTIVINFRSWDRSGPQVEVGSVPPQYEEIAARLAAA